ncbi:MAG: hypothetical protein M3081_18930 [Gemmatimonadota bacterium]|nr:hypothetical protein [Gemmatimonadota bacterium]
MDEHDLRPARKGQGLVITDGEQGVKASRVARDLSLKSLELRRRASPGKDHQVIAFERSRLSRAVVEVVDAMATQERVDWLRAQHARLTTELGFQRQSRCLSFIGRPRALQ